MPPADHSLYSKRSSRRKKGEIDKLLERMHIRLALAAFKAQYGYETCALDSLESKLIPHTPLFPYSDEHHRRPAKQSIPRGRPSNHPYLESPTYSERQVRSSSRRQVRKEYNDYVMNTPRSLTPTSATSTSPPTYYRRRDARPKTKMVTYLTPISPLSHSYHPFITADESAKRSTTPNNGSLTPRSLSPTINTTLHRSTRQQSPTPQSPSNDINCSLWDHCGLVNQPSIDETNAANLLMGLWYAR